MRVFRTRPLRNAQGSATTLRAACPGLRLAGEVHVPLSRPGVQATVIHFAGGGNRTRRASEVPTVSSKRNQNSATKTFRTLLKNAECTVQQIFTGEPCATCTPRDAPGPRPPRRALARGATLLAAVPRSFCLTQCVWLIPRLVVYSARHTAVSLLPLMDMSSDSLLAVRASSCLSVHTRTWFC